MTSLRGRRRVSCFFPRAPAISNKAMTTMLLVLSVVIGFQCPTNVCGFPRDLAYGSDELLTGPKTDEGYESAEYQANVARGLGFLRKVILELLDSESTGDSYSERGAEIQGSPEVPEARRKRTCLFNGGMSHSCDYKDVVGAVKEASYWNSDLSPGRKKREILNVVQHSSPIHESNNNNPNVHNRGGSASAIQQAWPRQRFFNPAKARRAVTDTGNRLNKAGSNQRQAYEAKAAQSHESRRGVTAWIANRNKPANKSNIDKKKKFLSVRASDNRQK